MAPKSKKGKELNEGGEAKISSGEDPEEESQRLELIKRAVLLQKSVKKEKNEHNDLTERTKEIKYFWDIEKKTLQENKEKLQEKEDQVRALDDKHQEDLDDYKAKIKHLLHEQQDELTRQKTETDKELKILQDQNHSEELSLLEDRNEYLLKMKESDLAHEAFLKRIQDEYSNSISTLRQDHDRRSSDLALKSERRLKSLREELENTKKDNMKALEERKDAQTKDTMKRNDQDQDEMRSYYNGITHKNLDLIERLKEEAKLMRRKQRHNDKLLEELTYKNTNIKDPLEQATSDLEQLNKDLVIFKEQKKKLEEEKSELLLLEGNLEDMGWQHEVMFQRYQALESERNKYRRALNNAMHDRQQKSHFEKLIQERKPHQIR